MQGIQWMRDWDSALLADEPGLGKTMQAILAARLLWRERRINQMLVICPKSLVPTWIAEIRKWWANAISNTDIIDRDPRWKLCHSATNITIKIINYEKLPGQLTWLQGQTFAHDIIVIDEAQRIKNPDSKTARAVKALNSKRRWALTGTPLENRVADVVSIFDFLLPGLLEDEDPDYVRKRIRHFMLRRRSDEVLKDLPEMFQEDVELELGPRQRDAYDRRESDGVVKLNKKGDKVTVPHVFALITELIQLCNFEPVSGDSVKLDVLRAELEEVIDSNRKALVFSRFVDNRFGIKRIAAGAPPLWGAVQYHGKIPQRMRQETIERLQNDPAVKVMLVNYRVGGLGLNLHAANYVYLFDRWWNPAVEDQAIKRVHRIGQKNKVIVRRFMCTDTIEERIVRKLAEKRRLFAHVIDETKLSPEALGLGGEELFSLFKDLTVRPRQMKSSRSGQRPETSSSGSSGR